MGLDSTAGGPSGLLDFVLRALNKNISKLSPLKAQYSPLNKIFRNSSLNNHVLNSPLNKDVIYSLLNKNIQHSPLKKNV